MFWSDLQYFCIGQLCLEYSNTAFEDKSANLELSHQHHTILSQVGELSSILSVNCLKFRRLTVFQMNVGELSCRRTVGVQLAP